MNTTKVVVAALLAAFAGSCLGSGITVPAGAKLDLAGGQLALADGDLTLGGDLQLDAGSVLDARNFQINGSGTAALGSGNITLFGDWSNAGTVNAGSSQVHFVDGGLATSGVLGATTFASVSFVSATGKRYFFASGSTQTVAGALVVQGTQAAPIQFDVTNPGSVARLKLLASGSQAIQHVGVSDVHATGQHLAPNQVNEGGRGNDTGWFRALLSPSVPVPGLTPWSALLLLLGLGLLAWRRPTSRNTIET